MSQSIGSQSQTNERVEGDSGGTPNGIEGGGSGSAHIDIVHFGNFHNQIQQEVERLQGGLSTVDGAIGDLTRTFGKYRKIVSTVSERYGNDQALEEEIRRLKAKNDGIWENIETDRQKHQVELSALQTLADAGKQEKKIYEELGKSLADEHHKKLQNMDRELKQKQAQLERENREKITGLEKEKAALEKTRLRLEQELKDMTLERDREKEARETMQNKARADRERLENELTNIKAKYYVERLPTQYYMDRYKGVVDQVDRIATLYFTDLPMKAIIDPINTSARLAKASSRFKGVPIGDSECSQVLRLANTQHVIFAVICDLVWQPFFSEYLWKHKADREILSEIYWRLKEEGEEVQRNWKVSTLKILERLDDMVDAGGLIDELIEKILLPLKHLLDDDEVDQFKSDLKGVFAAAIKLGKIAERDQSPVHLSKNPSVGDRDGWKEYLSDEYEISDTNTWSPTSPTTEFNHDSLLVRPKIYRLGPGALPTGAATTSIAAAAGRAEVEVIQPGVALFPNTGIFQEGLADWLTIQGASSQAARNTNAKGRRQSTSTSLAGSTILPSKKWSREGTREFD